MFKKSLVSAVLLVLASSNAFAASPEAEYGNELLAAKATIEGIVNGTVSVDPTPVTPVTPGTEEGGSTGTGWGFDDDARAQPEYLKSAIRFGDAGKKFPEADSLRLQLRFAESIIKRTEACADVNIALVDLSVANHYAILPGFSMILKPFNAQFKSLYDSINSRRGLICK